MEPDARERFDALVERLRKQVLDQYMAGLSDALQGDHAGGPRRRTARWSAT